MKKKGFATSAILYTLLLLFLVLMVGILNNLQNKKTILDALKEDTINALEKNTITDAILDQIAIINSKIVEIEKNFQNLQQQIPKFHEIYLKQNYATSTEGIYTGVSQTIPTNSYFCLTAKDIFDRGEPIYITINTSPNNENSVVAGGVYSKAIATTTYCNFQKNTQTYYIWTKREGSYGLETDNSIELSGFYIVME